ncbi:larval allergen, partial [Loa loa]
QEEYSEEHLENEDHDEYQDESDDEFDDEFDEEFDEEFDDEFDEEFDEKNEDQHDIDGDNDNDKESEDEDGTDENIEEGDKNHDESEEYGYTAKGEFIETDGKEKKCVTHVDCYDQREPQQWCILKEDQSWTDKGCFCDEKKLSCVIERKSAGKLQYAYCAPQQGWNCLYD